jgi:hypothetical protein
MTKFIFSKKVITNTLMRSLYKASIVFYSFYLAFSAQVFGLHAEAPAGGQSFAQIVFDDTAVLERKMRESLEKQKQERIISIESYYDRYNLPLASEAEHFINAAEEHGIDWRLVAAIGFIESTGGKHACETAEYSAFGWGSCKINFDSYAESIDVISMNLGGHNPNTAYFYEGKDLRGILWSYNPDTIRAGYGDMVINEMNKISPTI